jgi:hypothetical protein
MKTVTATLTLLMFSGVASAQNPDPSKWMCRNLSESGGFLYQGETIFGSQACRPISQAAPAATAPPSTTTTETPKADASSPTPAPAAAAPPATAVTAPKGFVLEDGTPVHLVLSENLSSADAVTGQTDGEKVMLRAVKDVKGGGHTGAMVGAMVATSRAR